jgi:hypothetical protein
VHRKEWIDGQLGRLVEHLRRGDGDAAVSTRLVVFVTVVVDLTDQLDDPDDVQFGVQLGGGTDINGAVVYCESVIRKPRNTILVLISDLLRGWCRGQSAASCQGIGRERRAVCNAAGIERRRALADDQEMAAKLAAFGVPSFACTPDTFAALMAAAIRRDDIAAWASGQGAVTRS